MRPRFHPAASLLIDALVLALEDKALSRARHDALRRRKASVERVFVPVRRPRR
jgi:hypothetical protein